MANFCLSKTNIFASDLSKTKICNVLQCVTFAFQRQRFLSSKDGLWDSACLISKTVFQRRKTKIFHLRIQDQKNVLKNEIPMLNNQWASPLVSHDLSASRQSPSWNFENKNQRCTECRISMKDRKSWFFKTKICRARNTKFEI